jgi:hypothetical protein
MLATIMRQKRANIGCLESERDAFNRIAGRWNMDQRQAIAQILIAMEQYGEDLQQLLFGIINANDREMVVGRLVDALKQPVTKPAVPSQSSAKESGKRPRPRVGERAVADTGHGSRQPHHAAPAGD